MAQGKAAVKTVEEAKKAIEEDKARRAREGVKRIEEICKELDLVLGVTPMVHVDGKPVQPSVTAR